MNSELNNIYSKPYQDVIYTPFNLEINPTEHLILINIEDDPDEFYKIFEVQQARDENDNKKILVIAYRNDGAVDIYHQPNYPLNSQSNVFDVVNFIKRPIKNAKFKVTPNNTEVCAFFEDKIGRDIELIISESEKQKKNLFSILAPVGGGTEKPLSLPIYLLNQMSFARRSYTNVEIKINGVSHQPDIFPLPIDWSRNYFTRYSTDAFIVDWNKNYDGLLAPIKPDNNCVVENQGVIYELKNNSGHYEIKQMSIENEKHKLKINFTPAIPDIICLKDGIKINGKFLITSDITVGTISGEYQIRRKQEKIYFNIRPGCWKPKENRWSLKILYLIMPIFKKWPSTYLWNAEIELNDEEAPLIKASWQRKKGWKEKLQFGIFKLLND